MKKQSPKPTIAGLALRSGIDRKTIRRRLVEAGLYPPDKHPMSECLKAIKPTGSGSTLETAKARLLDAKVRQIEREEKLRGGDVLPTLWFVECVNEAFRDKFSNTIQNVWNDAVKELEICRAPYISEGWTVEKSNADEARHNELKAHLFRWLEYAKKSLRISIDQTRNQLISHLKTGTAESGGTTSFGQVDDYFQFIAKQLSNSAHAEVTAALRSAQQTHNTQSHETKT